MKWMEALSDLFFPVCCPGCGQKTEREAPWCRACLARFWYPRLLSHSAGGALSGCYACCQYEDGIRRCLIRLKYGGRADYKAAFPPLLARFPWWERLAHCTISVPVPLHRERQAARGWNQTDLIFRDFLEKEGKIYRPDLLVRIRRTRTQSRLDLPARRDNMRGVFHMQRGEDVRGAHILLLDDIYTTGATMGEAARELKRAGAASVTGMVIASGSL